MKLELPNAEVAAVTPLMLKHGSGEEAQLVPASAITFKAEVNPRVLDELREGLSKIFFEETSTKGPLIPAIPEIEGAIAWATEYEGSTLAVDLEDVDDLDFDDDRLVLSGVDVKGITFEPLPKGMVKMKVNAIVQSDDPEMRGKLNAILRHEVKVIFTKMVQKPLAEPKKPKHDAAEPATDGRQQSLEHVH